MTPRRAFLTLLFAFFALFSVSAFAADPATDFVNARHAQLVTILKKPAGAARDAELKGVFDGMLDYGVLAQDSLGKNWSKLSAPQQKEFTDLLTQLIRRSYTKSLNKVLDYKLTCEGAGKGDRGPRVKTTAKHKSEQHRDPIHIEYQLQGTGSATKVVDIVTEGSSLVGNYRSQFGRVLRKDGPEVLLQKLRQKVADEH